MTRRQRDPLAPIEFGVSLVVGFVAISILLVGVLIALRVDNWTWTGPEQQVCVRVTSGALHGTSEKLTPPSRPLRSDIEVHAPVTEACTDHATSTERAWLLAGRLPGPVFSAGVMLMLWWTIRRARGAGIFSVSTAKALTRLGWYLVVGSLLTDALEFTADLRLFAHLVPDGGWPRSDFPVPVAALVTGLGVVSLGRVMQHAALLQDEVDATI